MRMLTSANPAPEECEPTDVRPCPARTRRTLDRRASFWVALGVSAHTLWTSAAPALSYRLYIDRWCLSPIETTAAFAIYPIFVVATLILFGDLSDRIGRRRTMLAALFCSLIGALMLAGADGLGWLLAARAIMGVGVALGSGSSTAAILEYGAKGNPERAAAVTILAQAIGFALALILGGAFIEYLPFPLRLNFLVLAAVVVVLIAAAWLLPQQAVDVGRWSPRLPGVPANMRAIFVVAALAFTCAFASGATLLSLGGQVAHDLVGSANALVSGTILASFAIVSAAVTAFGRRLSPRIALFGGVHVMTLGACLLWLAVRTHSLTILLGATSSTGAGYALLFLGALTLVNANAPASHRGGILSALYLVGYLSMGSFALALGTIARACGLGTAVAVGSIALAALGASALVFAIAFRSRLIVRKEEISSD